MIEGGDLRMKTSWLFLFLIGLAGCYASHTRPDVELEEIYRQALGKGAADQVSIANRQIHATRVPAGADVFMPIRERAWIVEAYVPDHVNSNGDHVRGHAVYLVIEPERWVTPVFPEETPQTRIPRPRDVPVVYEGK
jgi:hypothetical protein